VSSLPLLLVLSLALPLLLWPIEQFFPYPHLVEEMAKSLIAIFLANDRQITAKSIIWPIICGFLFALSETMFYLLNFIKLGHFSDLFKRILLTGCLHIGTLLLVYLGAKKNYFFLLLSFFTAVFIHYTFNLLASNSVGLFS
jgi:hypothetical protein